MRDLVAQFSHPDHKVREEAMQELRRHDAEAVPALLEALAHGETRVRVCALTVLGWLKDRRAVGPLADLAQMAGTSADERALAVKAVAEVSEPALRDALGLLDFFARFRTDADPAARAWAVRGIARLGDRTLAPYVEEARHDRDPWVRDVAAAALAELVGAVAGSTQPATSISSQASSPHEPITGSIQRLNALDAATRARATLELAAVGAAAIPALSEATRTALPHGRVAALHAIAQIGGRETIPVLLGVLADSVAETELRALAARALGPLVTEGDVACRAPLLAATRTTDRYLRAAAAAALAPFHDADTRAFLLVAAEDSDPLVRDAAIDALARSCDARDCGISAPIAEILLRTTDPKARTLLNQALRAIDKTLTSG